MNEIRGGPRKPVRKKPAQVYKVDMDEPDEPVVKKRRARTEESNEALVPTTIRVTKTSDLDMIPGSVWRTSAFKWDPATFVTESERLNDKIYDGEVQTDSLRLFSEDPTRPLLYCVAGNPSDERAKYFAAYLASLHSKAKGNQARIVWNPVYAGLDNRLLKDFRALNGNEAEPTLLILTGLTSQSTPYKLEKARDLLEHFCDVPRIVIAAGEDPISFMTTRLNLNCNAIAYFSDSLVKKRMEVI